MDPKLQFSATELSLVSDAGFILTKNGIMNKLAAAFQWLKEKQEPYLQSISRLSPALKEGNYKISRGENYLGLPWMVLDHPRHFSQHNIFAIRTMFWWGRFFSTTLHLSGSFKKEWEETILNSERKLAAEQWQLAIGEDPWQHHFEKEVYLPVSELKKDWKEAALQRNFLKIARPRPLGALDESLALLEKDFKLLCEVLEA